MKALTVAILLAFLFLVSAQGQQSGSSDEFTPTGKVSTQYDRFEEKTTVALDNMKLTPNDVPTALILALRGYYAGTPRPPSSIGFTLIGLSLSGYNLPSRCTLNVIADGTHSKYEFSRYKESMFLFTFYGQAFRIDMPYAEFQRLTRAINVEMRFCDIEVKLKSDQISQFKQFRKLLGDS